MFDNISEIKPNFTSYLKYFDIKPVLRKTKNQQANASVERVHQVILNMLATKDTANKVLDYKYPWGETLSPIAWLLRASYNYTLNATPDQAIFARDIILNLASVVDSQVITEAKQRQVDIDNFRENARQVTHDSAIGNLVYMEINGIYRKLDYSTHGTGVITEV